MLASFHRPTVHLLLECGSKLEQWGRAALLAAARQRKHHVTQMLLHKWLVAQARSTPQTRGTLGTRVAGLGNDIFLRLVRLL